MSNKDNLNRPILKLKLEKSSDSDKDNNNNTKLIQEDEAKTDTNIISDYYIR